ncbi:MAG: MgtC/SapB family protein [Candidatus Acidiferrales bacterium]
MLIDLNLYIIGKLMLAAVLGGFVGLERELSHKPAGLRTNMLICLGAALFTIISKESVQAFGAGDPTRIAAQIIPGIGFIGAGVVIRERGAIIGITSAATIFMVASIGMAVGSGLIATSIFASLLVLACLVVLGNVEQRLGLHARPMNFRVIAAEEGVLPGRVRQIADDLEIQPHDWRTDKSDRGFLIEFEAEVTVPQEQELIKRVKLLRASVEARPVRAVTPI